MCTAIAHLLLTLSVIHYNQNPLNTPTTMDTERTNCLLAEIAGGKGLIHIDRHDVDLFKANAQLIDAEKVGGNVENIGAILDGIFTTMAERNSGRKVKSILLALRIAENSKLMMEHMNGVHDAISKLGDEVESKWGLFATDLPDDRFEIIVALGF